MDTLKAALKRAFTLEFLLAVVLVITVWAFVRPKLPDSIKKYTAPVVLLAFAIGSVIARGLA